MRHFGFFFGVVILVVVGFLGWSRPARAMTSDFCLCHDNLDDITVANYKAMEKELEIGYFCEDKIPQDQCTAEGIKTIKGTASIYDVCSNNYANLTACEDEFYTWKATKDEKLKAAAKAASGLVSTKSQFIPDCALQDELTGECRDVNIFLVLAINISRYVFSIIGGLSLLMFVYGGFTMIISQGSSEKIQQGKNIMVAVVVGLLIAFGGYLLVNFLGQSLGLQQSFRLL